MKIVVLDGFTLNPGDLSWDALHALGEVALHDRTPPGEVLSRAQGAEIILTNKTPLPREVIEQLPGLRYIGVLATGYNVVDTAAAKERSIVVANVPSYGTRSVAQHAFALLLALTNGVHLHHPGVSAGEWSRNPDWSYWKQPLIELDGLQLGLVGRGRIGDAFAQLAEAAGMCVQSVSSKDSRTALENLLRESDVISLHCPLTPATKELINRDTLALCRPTAFLLNTARGPLINEHDLTDALNAGRLAGAGLDVLSTEPPSPDNPLLTARNCLITPHLAWATAAARRRLMKVAVDNIAAFLAGKPVHVVNG